MIFTECQKCSLALFIAGKPEDFEILNKPKWAQGFPCVGPQCDGIAVKVQPRAVHKELTVSAYFRALHGFGAGDTAPAAPERVQALLTEKRIVHVELEAIGQPERSLIHSITLEDGTLLHLAASNAGACIYLVEEPQSEDYRLVADPNSQRGPADRAQAGSVVGLAQSECAGPDVAVPGADDESSCGPGNRKAGPVHAGGSDGLRLDGHDPQANR